LKKCSDVFSFLKRYITLSEVLNDRKLASLGDTYINFVYSLALSNRNGKPLGTKVKGNVLAEAIRKTGLRKHLPARINRHKLADAAEALIIYAWLNDDLTLEESVEILEKNDDPTDGFGKLLITIVNKLRFF
jgi:hypothetical protein